MYYIPYHGERDLSRINFLVIGGAGFIGSNIVTYLLKFGAGKVRVLDNFSTGSVKNLENFAFHPSFELIQGDIRNLEDCKKATDGINVIFHEVALNSEPASIEDLMVSTDVNIAGFLNILVAAQDAGTKRIVYAAFSPGYRNNVDFPKSKNNARPLSPYTIAKYVNELYANVFCRLYHLEYIGLRYFNVFGPGQNTDGAYAAIIPKFIAKLAVHEPPVLNENSKVVRDFTFVENVVQANIIAAITDKADAINQNYNVASGEQKSLNELAALLRDSLAVILPDVANVNIKNEERPAAIRHSFASIIKTKRLLGYYPYVSIKEGIMETVKEYAEENKLTVVPH